MAIDRKAAQELITAVEELTQQIMGERVPKKFQKEFERLVMGPALEELRKLTEGRPPRLFFMGRAGHGKSSLINALAGKKVASTDPITPKTFIAERYPITFPERYASWDVVDSRGIFDSTPPPGAEEQDALVQLRNDLLEYRPDMILHVISAPEVRSLGRDMVETRKLFGGLKRALNPFPGLVAVLNRVDTLGDPEDWPPEGTPKGGEILRALEYFADGILKVEKKVSLDPADPLKGYALEDDEYQGVIPVKALWEKTWNLEALIDFIGARLPDETQLDFAQGLGRKAQMERMADAIVQRFAVIAGGIGAIPIPIADIILLSPLQLLMIGIVGGLSCRRFNRDTVYEFLASAGLAVGAGTALRYAAQELVKVVPVAGEVVAGGIAYGGTLAIGKAAAAYFFHGQKAPGSFFEGAQQWWGKWRDKTSPQPTHSGRLS